MELISSYWREKHNDKVYYIYLQRKIHSALKPYVNNSIVRTEGAVIDDIDKPLTVINYVKDPLICFLPCLNNSAAYSSLGGVEKENTYSLL